MVCIHMTVCMTVCGRVSQSVTDKSREQQTAELHNGVGSSEINSTIASLMFAARASASIHLYICICTVITLEAN